MRVLSFIAVLVMVSLLASAKNPPLKERAVLEPVSLLNGNVQMDMPAHLEKDREFIHYWDNCPEGGYTVAFSSDCNKKSGLSVQINVHDYIQSPEHMHDWYDPREHCLKNATVLDDTTFVAGGRSYTYVATQADEYSKGGQRTGGKSNNYNLSVYIVGDGRMLEFHYFYWGKKDSYIDYWKDISYQVASSIRWQSNSWVTAKN